MMRGRDNPDDLGLYMLDEAKEPVKVTDTEAWAKWLQSNPDRHVAKDIIGHYRVSTVFLGIDHQFRDNGPPILYETMVFDENKRVVIDGKDYGREQWEGYCERYATKAEAAEGHGRACRAVLKQMRKEQDDGILKS